MGALNDCQRIVDGKVFPEKRLTRIFAEAILELKAILEKPQPKSKAKSKPRKKVDPYSASGVGL